jgi:hypothetical protein
METAARTLEMEAPKTLEGILSRSCFQFQGAVFLEFLHDLV